MKKIIKLTLVLAFMMGSTSLFAQKLGRVDLESVIVEMPEYKAMNTNMEAFSKELRDILETIQVEMNTKNEEYQKNRASYSDTTRQLKERELMDLQTRLQESYETAQTDLQSKEQELMNPIIEKAQEAVKKVAERDGYAAIFSTAAMLYYNDASMPDLAPEVKKELGI
jgi:outer membrane protein